MVGDHPYRFMDVKFDKTNPPGSMHELLRKKSVSPEVTWGDSYSADNMLAAFQQRDERLGLMEEQGIETAILLPTFGASVEQTMVGDVDQTYANLRSFNRWLDEEWGFARDEPDHRSASPFPARRRSGCYRARPSPVSRRSAHSRAAWTYRLWAVPG